jgi:hypothetical protein
MSKVRARLDANVRYGGFPKALLFLLRLAQAGAAGRPRKEYAKIDNLDLFE